MSALIIAWYCSVDGALTTIFSWVAGIWRAAAVWLGGVGRLAGPPFWVILGLLRALLSVSFRVLRGLWSRGRSGIGVESPAWAGGTWRL
jgi:hypothetical protein